MKQIEVLDTVIEYLIGKGWIEIFSNRPGNDFASHGFVVPLKGKILDSLLTKDNQVMLLEADSEVSFKKGYHTKLLSLMEYLRQNQHLDKWIKLVELRNKVKIGKVKRIIPALAYFKTDFRFNLIKPELVSKGFHLYRTPSIGKVIEEHSEIYLKLNQFLRGRRNSVGEL
jgi:hypothetical protein